MVGIEIWQNGEKVGTAGLKDGIVTAKLTVRNQVDPVVFHAVGRDAQTGSHVQWAHVFAALGDEFTLKVVEF